MIFKHLFTKRILTQLGVILAAAILCLFLADAPFADDTKDSAAQLVQKLHQTLTALREKKQERYALAEKVKQRAALLQEELNSLQTERESLAAGRDLVKKENAALAQERDVLSRKITNADQELGQIYAAITDACGKLIKQIENGLPYRIKERKKLVTNFLESAGKDVAADVALLWQICMQEFELGFSSEIYTGEVNLPDGRRKEGKFLRVGRIVLAYLADDGQECGLIVNRNGKPELLSELRDSERAAIKEAFAIMQRQRSPALVIFPVYTKLSKQGENK